MKLTKLTKKTQTVMVHYLGETAEVEFKLAGVTPQFLDDLRGLDSLNSIIKQLERTVLRWDVLDENDQVIPPTEEAIRRHDIPIGFLSQVLLSIAESMNGWEKNEKKD